MSWHCGLEPACFSSTTPGPRAGMLYDIDGDGLADLINMGTAGSQQALVFNGTTWVNDSNYTTRAARHRD